MPGASSPRSCGPGTSIDSGTRRIAQDAGEDELETGPFRIQRSLRPGAELAGEARDERHAEAWGPVAARTAHSRVRNGQSGAGFKTVQRHLDDARPLGEAMLQGVADQFGGNYRQGGSGSEIGPERFDPGPHLDLAIERIQLGDVAADIAQQAIEPDTAAVALL